MKLRNYSGLLLMLSCCLQINAQDSTNIKDLTDKLILRLYTVNSFNSLSIENNTTKESLNFLPNGSINLGLGFDYKRIGFGIAFGLPSSSEDERKFGKTKRLDLQVNMYGRKIGTDVFFQRYRGFYNSNPEDFTDWDNDFFPQLPNMKLLSMGLASFFIFNSEKYSYRAAFIRDEMQKKSAGSFLLGVFGNYDEATTESGFIPSEFPDDPENDLNIKEFSNLAIGVSVGYAYNFVIKDKFIFGVVAIPGFGYQRVSFSDTEDNIESASQPAGQFITRIALGYEHRLFFLNFIGSVNFRSIDLSPYDFSLSTEQFQFILGKRF
jgi:hypothetical protein